MIAINKNASGVIVDATKMYGYAFCPSGQIQGTPPNSTKFITSDGSISMSNTLLVTKTLRDAFDAGQRFVEIDLTDTTPVLTPE